MSNYEIDQRNQPFSSLSVGNWLAFNTRGDVCQKISSDQIGFTVGNRFQVETIERIHDGVYPVYFYEPITESITEHGEEQALTLIHLNQGFDCEIDDADRLSCQATNSELTIALTRYGDVVGGITIGRGQIQNLIDYLEQVKEAVGT